MSVLAPSDHPNSKRITILRKSTFAEAAQTGAADFMALSQRSIGSYYESRTTQGQGTGLSIAERKLLIPFLIDIPGNDPTFLKACNAFYGSLVTKIPYGEGLTLEIGLELDNTKPVTYFTGDPAVPDTVQFNLPINIDHYVRYRHALKHPRVAASVNDAKGNQIVDFYIFDETTIIQETARANTQRDKALSIYINKVKDDMHKVDQLLTLMGKDPRDFYGPNKDSEKLEELRKLADTRALEFNTAYENKMAEEAYLVTSMVNTGVLKRMGNQFVEAETGKVLAHKEEEMMYFFKDPANSDKVVILKGALQEAMKKENKGRKQRLPAGAKI